jgi:5S rRNA maturation endonuclease (ribonuclease M5)
LVYCHAGCPTQEVVEAMGLQLADLYYSSNTGNGRTRDAMEPEAQYEYMNVEGHLLYTVYRYPGKRFKHVRELVPYRLCNFDRAWSGESIYITEGEKDVHALEDAGKVATCNAGGSGAWKDSLSQWFKGLKCIIVRDKDEPGVRHAAQVAESLMPYAESIWIVEAKEGKDAADHLAAGYKPEEFVLVRRVK